MPEVECEVCKGTGLVTCGDCKGRGTITEDDDDPTVTVNLILAEPVLRVGRPPLCGVAVLVIYDPRWPDESYNETVTCQLLAGHPLPHTATITWSE